MFSIVTALVLPGTCSQDSIGVATVSDQKPIEDTIVDEGEEEGEEGEEDEMSEEMDEDDDTHDRLAGYFGQTASGQASSSSGKGGKGAAKAKAGPGKSGSTGVKGVKKGAGKPGGKNCAAAAPMVRLDGRGQKYKTCIHHKEMQIVNG